MSVVILTGDVRQRLRDMAAESVHCVVTSPPYFGLRDYDTEPQAWGVEPDCRHEWVDASVKISAHSDAGKIGGKQASNIGTASVRTGHRPGDFCSSCGA